MASGYEERKRLTFEQAERIEPLPTQLALKEISTELRSRLWDIVYTRMGRSTQEVRPTPPSRMPGRDAILIDPWRTILYKKHIKRDFKPADEFDRRFEPCVNSIKDVIWNGDYTAVLGFVQWLLREPGGIRLSGLSGAVTIVLRDCQAAYAVFDGDTIIPISSEGEAETLRRAFADVASAELGGARKHLREAGSKLTEGDYGGSVKESIHAVEAVARVLEPDATTLGPALTRLTRSVRIHPALEDGFKKLYGYTSDEKGIRHSLVDASSAQVDEVDALYMLGSCAAFVSYLINKARNAGLIKA